MDSRTPPQNLEAEQSVLGSILLDNEVYSNIEGTISANHFYKEGHRIIFKAFEKLARRAEPIDLVTVTEELRQEGKLEAIGSVPYLIGLADSVPTAAYAENYAKIVAEKAVLRDLIGASGLIMQTAYDQAQPLEQILDKAEASIFDLSSNKRSNTFQDMGGLVSETFEHINYLLTNPDPVSGLSTGFKELDLLTAGLQPSALIVLAARPAMGKTAFALTIGLNAALRSSQTVGIFNLEMSGVQLVTRMLCSEARVDMNRIRNSQLSERDFQRLADTAGKLSEAKIYIDDNADLSIMELRARCRRLMAEHGLGLVIIDYLQLMNGGSGNGPTNRQQEISTMSRGLKLLARELDIPVIVLSQLSRAVESRPNKRPMLSDLRECVTGDTLVTLRDGRRIPIERLLGQEPEVLAITEQGKLTCAKSDKVWLKGKRPIFELKLASGRSIKATAKHRLFASDGWKRLSDLEVGDRLAIARYLPEPKNPEIWEDSQVALLGQLIGDGSYLKGQSLRYTTNSEANSDAVREGALSLGSSVKRYEGRRNWHQLLISGNGNRWEAKGVGKWLKELGIFNQRSHEKCIPEAAFRLSSAQTALLLRHLWATDGCIHVRSEKQKGSHSIYYSSTSHTLAKDVAALLLRFGIVARISQSQKASYKPSYQVVVSGSSDQLRFLEAIGAFGPKKEQADKLFEVLKNKKNTTNVDTLPQASFRLVKQIMKEKQVSHRQMADLRGTSYAGSAHFNFALSRATMQDYAELLDNQSLAELANSDLFWDSIVSITALGEENVYDLTVPGPASWLADSIVSHNSGAIEQDADLVMFIYRDEYYDQQSEKQGIAEIIIGKQRNGPVGTVELQFHNAHVRFNDLAKPTP